MSRLTPDLGRLVFQRQRRWLCFDGCLFCVVCLMVFGCLVSPAYSQWAIEDCDHLAWDYDYDPKPNIGLFRIYVSRESGVYPINQAQPNLSKPTAIMPAIPTMITEYTCRSIRAFLRTPGTYYAVVTAVSLDGMAESDPSNELMFTYSLQTPVRPPGAPPLGNTT